MTSAAARLDESRVEIAQQLGAIGIEPNSHWQDLFPDPDREPRLARFRDLLVELGPLFARFGRYLSTRIDRLPAEDCHTLAAIEDRREPLHISAIRARVGSALGADNACLPILDPAPFASRLLDQCHNAHLPDGRSVRVRVLRQEGDPALLESLAAPLSALGWSPEHVRTLVTDFRDLHEHESDFDRQREDLRQLARVSTAGQRFKVARVASELSSHGILTIETPEPWQSATSAKPARDLADLWLHLIYDGHLIPEQIAEQELGVAANGDLLISGGLFRSIDKGTCESLARYLTSAAGNDPDATFDALAELTEDNEMARPHELRHRLRHVVPRRDGRFGPEIPGLPELLLAHWSEAALHGLEPGPALLAFYRGLVNLRELIGPRLSEGVFHEAVRVQQIRRGARQARALLPPPWLPEGTEAFVERWLDLPRRSRRTRSQAVETEPISLPTPSFGPWGHLVIFLLLSATIVLWSSRLADAFDQTGGWLTAGALLVLSLIALRRL